jgi:glutamate transport system permease protein
MTPTGIAKQLATAKQPAAARRPSRANRSVLFDVPGPRSRRRTLIGSAVVTVVLLAVVAVALRRLADRGQLDANRWEFLTDTAIIRFLGGGLLNTLKVALVAGGLALAIGALLAMGRLAPSRGVRLVAGTWVEFWRAIPLLLLIYFIGLGFPVLGLEFPLFWFLVLGLTVYNSAVFAETFRTGVVSLHRGQREAAAALGLSFWQSMRLVQFPQAVRRMTPTLVSQTVTLLKDSSLGFVLPYHELLKRGQIVGQYSHSVLQAFVVVAVIFMAVNASLSYLARRLERRAGRPGRIPAALGVPDA